MLVSYNFYYARPGNAAAVLQQRIKASDVRTQLGLPRGRIISKVEGEGDWPDVIWRLDFADMALQDADMQARAASAEFEAIRHGMRQLYRRFERPLYAPCSGLPLPGQPLMMLYSVYCDASVRAAVRATLNGVHAVEFISGGTDIPQILCETTASGIPKSTLARLEQLPACIGHSLWQIADQG